MFIQNTFLLINTTQLDGCVIIIDAKSFTVSERIHIRPGEIMPSKEVNEALDHFAIVLNHCEAKGITLEQAFHLMDADEGGSITIDEFRNTLKDMRVPLSEDNLR